MRIALTLVVLCSFYFNVQSAKACAGAGLKKDDVANLMTEIESQVLQSQDLKDFKVLSLVWADIKPAAGSEGECEAQGLTATIFIITKDANQKYCDFSGTVNIFKSQRMGNHFSQKLEKGDFCE